MEVWVLKVKFRDDARAIQAAMDDVAAREGNNVVLGGGIVVFVHMDFGEILRKLEAWRGDVEVACIERAAWPAQAQAYSDYGGWWVAKSGQEQ